MFTTGSWKACDWFLAGSWLGLSGVKPFSCLSHRRDTTGGGGVQNVYIWFLEGLKQQIAAAGVVFLWNGSGRCGRCDRCWCLRVGGRIGLLDGKYFHEIVSVFRNGSSSNNLNAESMLNGKKKSTAISLTYISYQGSSWLADHRGCEARWDVHLIIQQTNWLVTAPSLAK